MNAEATPSRTVTVLHPERVLVFQDFANTEAAAASHGAPLAQGPLLDYLVAGRQLVEAHCYVPIDPRRPQSRDREIEELWVDGYVVHTKVGTPAGPTYKCDFDVEIAMDVTRCAHEVRPDTVVLVSGDCDFVPLVLELRKRGVRVEVAAFEGNGSREVILKSSGFIDLERYAHEAQAGYAEASMAGQDVPVEAR